MLNSQDRRPAFDAFFASLDAQNQARFLGKAVAQRDDLQDGSDYPVSLIDCMENVWDVWRDLRHYNPAHLNEDDRAIMAMMLNPEREEREREHRIGNGLDGSYPRSA